MARAIDLILRRWGDLVVEMQDLGPLAFDGVRADELVSSPIQRELLACLVATHPDPVSTDRLLELLWPGRPPRPRLVWTHVSRLRGCLAVLGNVRVDDVGGGYRLGGDLTSDAQRFTTIIEAVRHTQRHDPPAAGRWAEALALWRGEYLEGFDVDRMIPGRREGLRELRLVAGVGLAHQCLAQDEVERALAELEHLAADHPLSESVAELLSLGLYRSGRRAESLSRLNAFRSALGDETGLEPGPGLVELERRILADDPGLAPNRPGSGPPITEPLPRWMTSFVGRSSTIDELRELLDQRRLVTLVGPAGVGKTRLAVEVASLADHATNPIFVDLGVADLGSEIDQIAARSLGLTGLAGDQLRPTVLRHLNRQPRLLILDNCEHVIDQASRLAAEIVRSCPDCRVLATSRERLRVPGEAVLKVEPLSVGDDADGSPALQLLADRAGRSTAGLDRTAALVLCQLLDGLPLAIELAANRLFSMPISDLIAQMDNRFTLLDVGDRTAPERHQTLAAAVGWSIDDLTENQRTTLIRCSAFAGRFSSSDAAEICADDDLGESVVRTNLVDLVDRSLVDFGGGDAPYRLLDTIRRYGRDELRPMGAADDLALRHATHFAAKAVASARHAFGPREVENFRQVMAQSADYRNAIVFAKGAERWETLADLIWGITNSTFFLRGGWLEPVVLVEDLAFTVPDPAPPRWSTLIAAVASRFQNTGLLQEAERAGSLATTVDPTDSQAWVQYAFAALRSDPEVSIRRATEAVRVADRHVGTEILPSLNVLGQSHCLAGDPANAIETAQLLIEHARRFRSVTAESFAHVTLSMSLPPGSSDAAAAAGRAVEMTPQTQGAMLEVFASTLCLTHTLGYDLEEAEAILATNLDRRAIDLDATYEHIMLGGAAAFFAVAGQDQLALQIGRAIGALYLPKRTGLAPVEELGRALIEEGHDLPDPAIEPGLTTERVRDALRRRATTPPRRSPIERADADGAQPETRGSLRPSSSPSRGTSGTGW